MQLRKLNQVVFPVSYSEQFYSNIQKPDVTAITKLGQTKRQREGETRRNTPDTLAAVARTHACCA